MKRQATNSKLLTHFAIGFIIYQVIGDIAAGMVETYFEDNSFELFMKYGENKVYIMYFLLVALVVQSIATFLSTKSLCKHFEIRKSQLNSLVLSIAVFFIIIALIAGTLNSERFVMVFIINAIVLMLLMIYVYFKISSTVIDSSIQNNIPNISSEPESHEVKVYIPEEETKNEQNIQERPANIRFNPITGTIEERPANQPEIPNSFEQPVEQQEQQTPNYMDIFSNPINNDQSNQAQNNNGQNQ